MVCQQMATLIRCTSSVLRACRATQPILLHKNSPLKESGLLRMSSGPMTSEGGRRERLSKGSAAEVADSDVVCHAAQKPGLTSAQVFSYYDTWATKYDQDLFNNDYNGPFQCAMALAEALGGNKGARILDAASGTGLLGEELIKLGYTNLDAIDGSQGMLDIAKSRNLYHKYMCDFLGPQRLDIEDNCYDAVGCCGSFSEGHLKPDCLPEFIRVTKPGGIVCISMREEFLHSVKALKDKLEPAMMDLENKGCWERVARDIVPNYYRDLDGINFTYRVI